VSVSVNVDVNYIICRLLFIKWSMKLDLGLAREIERRMSRQASAPVKDAEGRGGSRLRHHHRTLTGTQASGTYM
jgi:hypothetical protein